MSLRNYDNDKYAKNLTNNICKNNKTKNKYENIEIKMYANNAQNWCFSLLMEMENKTSFGTAEVFFFFFHYYLFNNRQRKIILFIWGSWYVKVTVCPQVL